MKRSRMLTAVLVSVVVFGAACAAPTTPPPDEPAVPAGDDAIGINQIQMIGSHNSYHRLVDNSLLVALGIGSALLPDLAAAGLDPAQLLYQHRPLVEQLDSGIRTFELDIWADPAGGLFAHPLGARLFGLFDPPGMTEPGFKVLHIQDIDFRSSCPSLAVCLATMRAWSDAHPDHLPIVINLELKDDPLPAPFDATQVVPFDGSQLDAVDAELRDAVGDRLITPDDVRGSAPDLRTAVTTTGWPSVADSRGKFLFFMDNANLRDAYLVGHPALEERVMFTSSGFGQADGAILKVNEPGDGSEIRSLVEQGFMVRTRADADVINPSPAQRDTALASGAQIVHTDFPPGEPKFGSRYIVTFGTRTAARCNPVNTTAATCQPAAAVEPVAP